MTENKNQFNPDTLPMAENAQTRKEKRQTKAKNIGKNVVKIFLGLGITGGLAIAAAETWDKEAHIQEQINQAALNNVPQTRERIDLTQDNPEAETAADNSQEKLQAGDLVEVKGTEGYGLNLRAEPRDDSDSLLVLAEGSQCEVVNFIGQRGQYEWAQITCDGNIGFAATNWLEITGRTQP